MRLVAILLVRDLQSRMRSTDGTSPAQYKIPPDCVGVALGRGTAAGLEIIDRILRRGDLCKDQFAHSARGKLLRRAGETSDALTAFRQALKLARQEPERRFLAARIKDLSSQAGLS